MLPQSAFLIGAGVLGAIIAVVVVARARYNYWEEQQHRPPPREPSAPRIIGKCGSCDGDVTDSSGYALSCNHYMHHTCAVAISREFQGVPFNWTDVCRFCVRERMRQSATNSGLRNRGTNRQECAECLLKFVRGDPPRVLPCGHGIHDACWNRLQASDLTTCSMCMDDAS